ncbi:MAG: DUF4342 domain-containing protein [Ignavibacteriales bacterium]
MEITLEMIDQIRSRTGVSYKEAREVLERANGDVVQALIMLEEKGKAARDWTERIQVSGNEVLEKVKQLLHEGNVTKIVVKQGDTVVAAIPVTVGAVGAVIAPYLAAVGVAAAVATKCTIEFERKRPAGPAPSGGCGEGPVTLPKDVDK